MDSLKCLNRATVKLLNKNKLLKPLVKSELSNLKLSAIKYSDEIKENLINKFLKDNKIKDMEVFNKWISKNHGDRERFEENFLNSHRFRTYCKDNFLSKSEERYLSKKNNLDLVVYSLIRVKEPYLAKELYLQIVSKEKDFGDLASRYSEGEERKTLGIVGPVALSKAHPKIVEILKSSGIKDVAAPIKVDQWNVIIRLESREESNLDDLMKQRMAEEIFDEILEVETTQKVNELLKEAEII